MTDLIVPADAIRVPGSRTLKFEGAGRGSSVSFFLVDAAPGEGPALHRHPYDETWTVLAGEARVTVGDVVVTARAGDTAVAPAGAWHAFTNSGTDQLRIICIHASPVIIQELFVAGA